MSSFDEVGTSGHLALPAPTYEFDRVAIVAIQGGGVYGLSMLGQLSAVIEKEIVPIALSGTSAGAVVATLFWVGYSPKQIRDMFIELAAGSGGRPDNPVSCNSLIDLVGPFDGPPPGYDYHRFRSLAESIVDYIRQFIHSADSAVEPRPRWLLVRLGLLNRPEFTVGLAVALVLAAIGFVCWKWVGWGAHTCVLTVALGWLVVALVVCRRLIRWASAMWRIARDILDSPWAQRGFFKGDQFEAFINEKLINSPRINPYALELDGQPLTFGRIAKLRADHPDDILLDFVPLILTATNLDKRELILISSYDNSFSEFPVARAVRASAGFPVFFRPIDFTSGDLSGCYVDGGVIANYPAWVFSRRLRSSLYGSEYQDLARRPWLNIGLRVTGDPLSRSAATPGGFLRAIFDLVRGQIRDQLEKALSDPLPRTLTIEQPSTNAGAPQNFLDIHELNHDKIHTMFSLGREFACETLKNLSFALPVEDGSIRDPLALLIKQINRVLGRDDNAKFRLRANVFVPWKGGLVLRYAFGMDGHPDRGLVLRDNKGLTGTCYSRRRPYLCNLEILRAWALWAQINEPEATQLGMTPQEHLQIPEDRTFLINVPIFDPKDSWMLEELPERAVPEAGTITVWSELQVDRDGAVLGVLNVDGAIPYAELHLSDDPESSLTDARISSIVHLLWACSIDIGRVLSRAFAKRG